MKMRDWKNASVSVETTLLAGVMAAVTFLGLPLLEQSPSGWKPIAWEWEPAQQNAWNPYDCLFWQDLPPAEFVR
jgi:hypothetical protein